MQVKRKAYIIFTANGTHLARGEAPRQPNETARIEISRRQAAAMMRNTRRRFRLTAGTAAEVRNDD